MRHHLCNAHYYQAQYRSRRATACDIHGSVEIAARQEPLMEHPGLIFELHPNATEGNTDIVFYREKL